jgi:hypothetical protein
LDRQLGEEIMGTSYVAHTDRRGATWLPIGLSIAGLLAVSIAAATLAPRLGILGQGANPGSAEQFGYGAGYPMHFGLAGPSQLSVWAEHVGYGAGYPMHFGLAGPSQLSVWAEHVGYGDGYPLHGGLAGPSQVDESP